MGRDGSEQKLIDSVSRGGKPSEELKAFYKKLIGLSAAQRKKMMARVPMPRFPKNKSEGYYPTPGLRRWGVPVPARLYGDEVLFSPQRIKIPPCAYNTVAMVVAAPPESTPGPGQGFTYSPQEEPQVGEQVAVPGYDFPGHTWSSLVRPASGEFSLAAAVNTKEMAKLMDTAYYPPQEQLLGGVGTLVSGNIMQAFFVPDLPAKAPANIEARAIITADHVLRASPTSGSGPAVNTSSEGAELIYGSVSITLYEGFELFGIAPKQTVNYAEFLNFQTYNGQALTDFSALDDNPTGIAVSTVMPYDGSTDIFFVEINIEMIVAIADGPPDEFSVIDLRLVDDNRTLVWPDSFTASDWTPPDECPIVLQAIALCAH